ncbi:cytochrome C oxidase subunit IV, partial [Phyllobacterium sp. TAF24]
VLLPPILVLVFVAMMVSEAHYVLFSRLTFFGTGP